MSHPEILAGSSERGVKQSWMGKARAFSSFMRQYLENGTRYTSKVTRRTNG